MSEFKLSKSSLKNIKGVDKRLIELVKRVLMASEHDFGIPAYGGLRTAQEQNNLYHKKPKVTKLDGFKNKSYHQTGKAFDIFIYFEGKACWDCVEKYKDVAKLFKEEFEKMKWAECVFEENEFLEHGGDWRWKDYPHFQIVSR